MNDFDRQLHDRLALLESVVPASARPIDRRTRSRRSWRGALRIGFLAAALVVAGAAAAIVTSAPEPVSAELESARSAEELAVFDAYDAMTHVPCPTADDMKATARAIFASLGLDDWTIRDDGRHRDAPCVGMAVIGDAREVRLMPSMGEVVAEGLDRLRNEMLATCFERDAAVDLVTSFLVEAGMVEPDVQVGGMRIMPIDRQEQFEGQLADGCHVYSNAQFDEHGRYTWYVAGP